MQVILPSPTSSSLSHIKFIYIAVCIHVCVVCVLCCVMCVRLWCGVCVLCVVWVWCMFGVYVLLCDVCVYVFCVRKREHLQVYLIPPEMLFSSTVINNNTQSL